MQLKKLEMCGFKSFANRTEVVFEPGVTGIVGPNGCGKSNIVDAIKWVLGTLSYKAVRGEEMLDVIFKGAQGVAPMGFAEVGLTLDNSDKSLPIEYEEVTITRRIYRSGEGEYYINRAPCRLKDIRELLYGTGIGTDNYSIIEQGKIDRLVLSNPRERRLVFDEAAGISKYRAKKRETESRLEKVTGDLLRLQDIVREVQRELRSVRAQAGRAQRYKELNDELSGKRRRLLTHEYRVLRAAAEEIARRMADLEERRHALEATLSDRRTALEAVDRETAELASKCAAAAADLASAESKAGYLAQSVQSSEQRLGELQAERGRREAEREAQARKIAELEAGLDGQRRERGDVEAELGRLAVAVEEAQAALAEANRECARVADELERCKSEAMELARKESQYRSELAQAKNDREHLAARASRLQAQTEEVEREHGEVSAKLEEVKVEKSLLDAEIAELMTRRAAEEDSLAALKVQATGLDQELRGLREDRERRFSRRETLRDFELQMEGLDSGVKELLRAQFPGVLGTVADFLEVAPEDVPFVEAALGDLAGTVVCDSLESAMNAIRYVKERKLGRTCVLARELCRSGGEPETILTGIVGRVSDLVRPAPEHAEWVKGLLGPLLLVDSGEAAGTILAAGLTPRTMVTRDGDLFHSNGVFTTGSRAGAGILSRKTELRRLDLEIEDYDRILAEREARRADVDGRIRTAEEKLTLLRQRLYEQNVARVNAASREEQLDSRAAFLQKELETARIERQQIDVQLAAAVERGAAVERLLAELEGLKGRVEEEVASLRLTLARYEQARGEVGERLAHARVERGKVEEKLKALDQRIEMMDANLREVRGLRQKTEEMEREILGRIESVVQEIEARKREQEGLTAEIEGRRSGAAELEAQRAARSADLESARREADAVEADRSACVGEIQELRVREGESRVKLENLLSRARDEQGIDVVEIAMGMEEEPDTDWGVLSSETEELRRKVQSFGAVNVEALTMLEGLETREKELLGQQEDLTKTKAELEELIRKLNRESQDHFQRTIEVVREHFNTIFRKLFGGGKADIVVEEAEGVEAMDQGLQIMARPPAKDFTTISLLSGGERSMTALALVMALFKANPSPFCILDEADAALDEKNVERYAALVSEFVEETQFIIVTHNKRTMAVADVMYGVTMETPGVSKKVAVSLNGDEGLDLLRRKKIAARQARQVEHAQQAQAASATAVLEEEEIPNPNDEIPNKSQIQNPNEEECGESVQREGEADGLLDGGALGGG